MLRILATLAMASLVTMAAPAQSQQGSGNYSGDAIMVPNMPLPSPTLKQTEKRHVRCPVAKDIAVVLARYRSPKALWNKH